MQKHVINGVVFLIAASIALGLRDTLEGTTFYGVADAVPLLFLGFLGTVASALGALSFFIVWQLHSDETHAPSGEAQPESREEQPQTDVPPHKHVTYERF